MSNPISEIQVFKPQICSAGSRRGRGFNHRVCFVFFLEKKRFNGFDDYSLDVLCSTGVSHHQREAFTFGAINEFLPFYLRYSFPFNPIFIQFTSPDCV